jgi:predicted RNA-binding Zn-ribbon protein involved in translation (DUF1610 family)
MTMSTKGLRLAEVWFQRGLWIIAIVFAGFLIGLGGKVVDDLPRVENAPGREGFVDRQASAPLQARLSKAQAELGANGDALEQAMLLLTAAEHDTQQAREAFRTTIATRHATADAQQDPSVTAHAQALEAATRRERDAQARIDTLKQNRLTLERERDTAQRSLDELDARADEQYRKAQRIVELRVFGIRLLFTLPLLLIAGWLFAKKRKSRYWPFAWGFIFFALFAFFVELVPYLPSYGGYVRYAVRIVLTVLLGRYAIRALSRYIERKREEERQPSTSRREALDFVKAYAQVAAKVCPGCERPIDTADPHANFCPHCGIAVFNHCAHCQTRKNAFSRFCHACGQAEG